MHMCLQQIDLIILSNTDMKMRICMKAKIVVADSFPSRFNIIYFTLVALNNCKSATNSRQQLLKRNQWPKGINDVNFNENLVPHRV